MAVAAKTDAESPSETRPSLRGSRRRDVGEAVVRLALAAAGAFVVLATLALLAFIAKVGLRGIWAVGIGPLLGGRLWKPEAGTFGGLPLVLGTFVSASGAVVVGAVPAILAALWATELGPASLRPIYRRTMEIASAVPSVVYGWLALVNLVPLMEKVARAVSPAGAAVGGEGLASSAVLLGIMIAPTVLLLSLDALGRVPAELRAASAALGASPFQTAFRVSLPYAWRGLLVAVFFGFARAAGETMAVQMVIGGARRLPESLFAPTTTISTQVVMDMQNARPGTVESDVLFSMSLVLLLISVLMVLTTRLLSRRAGR